MPVNLKLINMMYINVAPKAIVDKNTKIAVKNFSVNQFSGDLQNLGCNINFGICPRDRKREEDAEGRTPREHSGGARARRKG